MSTQDNGIYRIKEVGAYYVAHYNIYTTHFIMERPGCGIQFDLNDEQMKELIKMLSRIHDFEDGKYIHKMLVGEYLHLTFDNRGIVDSVGDAFAENHIPLHA